MSKNISKNYLYNMSYQVLTIITPLITTPYLSQVLGPEGIGIYSFTTSIVTYFILLASLGVANYAQREIAYHQTSSYEQSRIFYEINLLRIIMVTVSSLIYYVTVIYDSDYQMIYWIQTLNIIAVLFDISWFFQGLEEFGKIVFRNFIVKLISTVLIFVLIQEPTDLPAYIALLGFMNILSGLSMWLYLPQYLQKVPINTLHIFRNFSVILQLFLPQLAIQMYTVLDKTMIGVITQSSVENGYYEQAEKIIKLSLTIITSLGTVMMPRIAFAFANKKTEDIKSYMLNSYRFVLFVAFPMCFGCIAIAPNFVPWFFGINYMPVILLMQILSFLFICIGLSNVTGIQYLLPTNQQNKLTLSVVIGAITNIILNMILIPLYQSKGAAIASIIAEMAVTISQFYIVRRIFSFQKIFSSCFQYLISSFAMFIGLILINQKLSPSLINTTLLMLIGLTIYLFVLLLTKDTLLLKIANKLKSKFHK